MPRASGANTIVSYIAEVTENVTPTTPVWKRMRVTSEALAIARETQASEELDPTRNTSDLVIVSGSSEGSVSFEFSPTSFEDILERALWGSWATDVLTNGVERKPVSLEVRYDTHVLSTADTFKRISGAYVSEFNLEMDPTSYVKGSATFMGRAGVYANAIVAGATYTAPPTTKPVSGANMVITAGGGLVVDCVSRLTMNINNGLRAQRCLGSADPSGIGYSDFAVSGDFEAYLSDTVYATFAAYTGNSAASLQFTLGADASLKTLFNMPSIRISDLGVVAEGKNGDVMIKGSYRAIYNSGILGTLRVTRNVA